MSELVLNTPRWMLPIINAPKGTRYIGAYGGRGSGKTWGIAEMIVEGHLYGKRDTICLRETQKSIRFSSKKTIEETISRMNVGSYFDIQDKLIRSKFGGVILFDGLGNHTAESIKSLEGFDEAWFDEAQAATARSLTVLRPTLRKPDSRLIFSWNPRYATDPIEELLRNNKIENSVIVQVNYADNPYFTSALEEERLIDQARDPDLYAHVWLGQHVQHSEARVFKNWRVEECEPPNGVVFRLGADFGFSIDPSCLIRCWIEGRNLYIDYEAWQIGCEIDKLPTLFMSVPDAERWPLIADSARPETISYLKNHGFPRIQSAVKGARSLEEGVEFLKSFDIIVHPRCKHVVEELTLYRYKIDPATEQILPILNDKNNHCIDALRYACEGVRRATKAVERKISLPPMKASPW